MPSWFSTPESPRRAALGEQNADQRELGIAGAQEDTALLFDKDEAVDEERSKRRASLEELDLARNIAFAWSFFIGVSYGIYLELFTNFCYDVLDQGNYELASLISTDAAAAYSITSIVGGTVLSTMSDRIGRVPLYKLACTADVICGIMMGVLDNNACFILFNGIMGLCDASTPIGYALLADYAMQSPRGHAGSSEDNFLNRWVYWIVKSYDTKDDAASSGNDPPIAEAEEGEARRKAMEEKAIERELNTHITVQYGYSTLGYVAGIWIAKLTYDVTGSYRWSFGSQGLWCLPIALVIWIWMPETNPHRSPANFEIVKNSIMSSWATLKLLCTTQRLAGILVVICIVATAYGGVFDVLLYWGEWKFGWQTEQEAIALTIGLSTVVIGCVLCNRLSRFIGLTRALVVLFAIATTSSILLGFATSNKMVWVCLGLMGIGLGLFASMFTILALEVSPEDQGRIQGASYSMQNVCWIVGIYSYWAMFETYVDDDGYSYQGSHHNDDIDASLYLWVTAGLTTVSGFILFALGEKNEARRGGTGQVEVEAA